jgi:hypothetical protein
MRVGRRKTQDDSPPSYLESSLMWRRGVPRFSGSPGEPGILAGR